jgi:alpha-ketoglutarate-dependent taurine dioxygenase
VERQAAEYWNEKLRGAPAHTKLPTDFPRPAAQSFRGAVHRVSLSAGLARGVRDLCRTEEVTPFMALLAVFYSLIARWSGDEDLCVGSPVAGRTRTETEGLIGFFANTLVLRTNLGGNPTFREVLARVKETALGAYAHQDVPFERLVEIVRPTRDPGRNPLFQVNFRFRTAPPPTIQLNGLQTAPADVDPGIARFDLALDLWDQRDGLGGYFEYCTDLYSEATMLELKDAFCSILETVVADPATRLFDLVPTFRRNQSTMNMSQPATENTASKGPRGIRRKAVDVSTSDLVGKRYLTPESRFPVVLEPKVENLDLAEWGGSNRDFIDAQLLEHGAILYRGFDVKGVKHFEQVARSIYGEVYGGYGDLPREQEAERIYHSTPYPPDKMILFHNESSHLHLWPTRISFYCVKAAEQGGETPIVDCHEMYRQLDPQVVNRIEQKGLMYVRNFSPGLDVSWQKFFHTEDRSAVEDTCRRAKTEFEWKPGDSLCVRNRCPGIVRHPRTGDKLFFNQVQLHHIYCLDPDVRTSLRSLFAEDDLPRNVKYGDGTPIEDSVMEHIGETYLKVAAAFPWQERDIIMLDNMRVAHARNPYVGDRKIVVAMGDMMSLDDLSK